MRRPLLAALGLGLAALLLAAPARAGDRLEELPGYERFRAVQRATAAARGGGRISNVDWAEDGKSVSFRRGRDLCRFDLVTRKLEKLATRDSGPDTGGRRRRGVRRGGQRDRERSPDGKWIAEHRDWNVVLVRTDELGGEVAVTTGGTRKKRYGKASWVYGEELDQTEAMWWSPDASKLVFYELDEREVPDFHLVSGWTRLHTGVLREGYPKPGEPNPIARLLIYDLASKKTYPADVNVAHEHYLYDVRFAPRGELLVNRTNRHQNVLEVLAVDVATGASRVVLTEKQPAWQKNSPTMRFLADGARFIWETEKNFWSHYELRHIDGRLLATLTRGAFPDGAIAEVNEARGEMWYTGYGGAHPLNGCVYRVGLDGTGQKRLTDGTTNTDLLSVAPDGEHFIARSQTLAQPPAIHIFEASGERIGTLATTDTSALEALGVQEPELFSFKADDGVTEIYGSLHRPSDFDPSRRYPLVIDVYGGPLSSGVRNTWSGAHAATELGFVVAKIGNRGTTGRGKAFETATYLKLGIVDIKDQVDGVRHLAKRPWIDGDRVGIYGHSYGGYMSALAVLKFPDDFHVAVAGAPVTDWRQYDTIYTERFMRTPQENPKGYDEGSCLTYAKNLRGKLLIVQGLVDDNVHPNNTLQLVERLHAADRRFDLQVFPNAGHGIGDPYGSMRWEYLYEHLVARPNGSRADEPARSGPGPF